MINNNINKINKKKKKERKRKKLGKRKKCLLGIFSPYSSCWLMLVDYDEQKYNWLGTVYKDTPITFWTF